jgi:hypothetical protein
MRVFNVCLLHDPNHTHIDGFQAPRPEPFAARALTDAVRQIQRIKRLEAG